MLTFISRRQNDTGGTWHQESGLSVQISSDGTVRVVQRLLQGDLLQLRFHSAAQDNALPVCVRLADEGQGPGTAVVVELTGRLGDWLNDRKSEL